MPSPRSSWKSMIRRCTNPKADNWKYYGGRGIKVCDRWLASFANFLEDMGERPSPQHTLDRKENDGDYCLENCRWATRRQQARNTRRSLGPITIDGVTRTVYEWAKQHRIKVNVITSRLNRGWPPRLAVFQPCGVPRR